MIRRLALIASVCGLVLVSSATAARQPAPPISGPTVTGGKASLAALRGKPVFINVWSSW